MIGKVWRKLAYVCWLPAFDGLPLLGKQLGEVPLLSPAFETPKREWALTALKGSLLDGSEVVLAIETSEQLGKSSQSGPSVYFPYFMYSS